MVSKRAILSLLTRVATLALLSCGDSSFILKAPLMAGCQKAGLPKCPELADGVIAYVDGDKEKAEQRIRGAVVGAEPDKVKMFIKALEALDNLPGSGKFMGPVHDVIAMLEGKSPTPGGSARGAAAASGDTPSTSGVEASGFTHLRASTVVVPGNPQAKNCTALSYVGATPIPALCLAVATGPLIITDLDWPQGCAAETFALAGDSDQPIWFLHSDEGHGFAMHGGALIIPAGAPFFIGHRLTSPTPLRQSTSCAVTWAGRRP